MALDALTLDSDPLTLDADGLALYDVDVVIAPEGSSAARWSYTAIATHWACIGLDDWTRVQSYASPVLFLCDYRIESQRVTDEHGDEFVAKLVVYTGRDNIKRGDYVLIGQSTEADPRSVANAREVRAVTQYADTFERTADDFAVMTI